MRTRRIFVFLERGRNKLARKTRLGMMACGKGGQLCARQVLNAVCTSAASWPSKTMERFAQQLTASSAGLSWRLDVPYRMGSWLYPSADACVSAFLAFFVFIYSPHTFSMRCCSCFRKVWWERVVADGAQLLGNQRSARAVAAFALVGTARWCVVERESMAMIENTSERMRVGGWVGGWVDLCGCGVEDLRRRALLPF